MSNLFIAFFCLLLWGNFFFRQIDCWHASGQFVQVSILLLFCYSFFEKPKYVQILNKPLGLFVTWAGLITAYGWIAVFSKTQHYPVKIFMPFFNLLCLILLYKLIVEYLTSNCIKKIFEYLKYSVMVLLFYCILQYFKLDEFFSGLNNTGDQLVGTISNSMHLAGLLAILQPLFFKKSIIDVLSLIVLWGLIFLTGSATGLVAGIAVILFWLWFKKRKLAVITLGLSPLLFAGIYLLNKNFFFNNSRFDIWKQTFGIIKNHFITGFGLGTFGIQNIKRGAVPWQHLHNDYYQIVFELGIIGLVLVFWCILDYFKRFNSLKTDLSIKMASMFFGFCLLCGVTFFAHLWITSVLGMFVFAGIYCLANEVKNENKIGNQVKSSD